MKYLADAYHQGIAVELEKMGIKADTLPGSLKDALLSFTNYARRKDFARWREAVEAAAVRQVTPVKPDELHWDTRAHAPCPICLHAPSNINRGYLVPYGIEDHLRGRNPCRSQCDVMRVVQKFAEAYFERRAPSAARRFLNPRY